MVAGFAKQSCGKALRFGQGVIEIGPPQKRSAEQKMQMLRDECLKVQKEFRATVFICI